MQIRGWKKWEEETSSHGYEFSNGMSSSYDVKNKDSYFLVIAINLYVHVHK